MMVTIHLTDFQKQWAFSVRVIFGLPGHLPMEVRVIYNSDDIVWIVYFLDRVIIYLMVCV